MSGTRSAGHRHTSADPRLLTWGATHDETTGAYRGDELVPGRAHASTMATTLPVPPERVWRWLVQMGGGRGGWYSWDWLDNDGKPSADRIVPEWQSLEEGQHLHRAPTGENWFTVAILLPNRTLVLHSAYGMFSGGSFDPRSGPAPWAYIDGIWGFHLRPAPGGRTRLVVRSRSGSAPGRWRGRSAGCSGNRCASSCRPASSTTCAPASARRCDPGRG